MTDRLRADFVEFDSFKPRDAGAATLRYASADEEEANDPDVAAAFQAVGEVTDGALSYRLGDTVIADVSWNEAVTRPYGAYFQLAANRKQHVKQSDVTLAPVAVHVRCRRGGVFADGVPPARAGGCVARRGVGRSDVFPAQLVVDAMAATAQLEDPCDVVGRGASAWSLRMTVARKIAATGRTDSHVGALVPRGMGHDGIRRSPRCTTPPGTKDGFRQRARSRQQRESQGRRARARRSRRRHRPRAGGLGGKERAVRRGGGSESAQNVAPSVVELYAEPSAFTWNMYRRVVAAGQYVVFHFYFDQPALRVRLWIGNDGPRESLVKHENIAPAYKVHKPLREQRQSRRVAGAEGSRGVDRDRRASGDVRLGRRFPRRADQRAARLEGLGRERGDPPVPRVLGAQGGW